MQETKSNWDIVAQKVRETREIHLDTEPLSLLNQNPDKVLLYLNMYKFAAKLIGSGKRVLDVGCHGGFGTYLLMQECGMAVGIDKDTGNICSANQNFENSKTSFQCSDFHSFQSHEPFSAITYFCEDNSLEIEELLAKSQELLSPSGLLFFTYSPSKHNNGDLFSHMDRDQRLQHLFVFSIIEQTITLQYNSSSDSHIVCCVV